MDAPTIDTTSPPTQLDPFRSVKVSADAIDELVTRRHRRCGPDADGIVLRALVWIALESAETGHQYVEASPLAIERAYQRRGATCGGMTRHGMDARTLRRHWPRIASYLVISATGKVRLKRTRRFHAWSAATAAKMVYDCTTPTFRALMGASTPWSAARARKRRRVSAPASVVAVRTGQGPSRHCVAMRLARIGELVDDSRPGRKFTDATRTRHPSRQVYLDTSPAVPLAGELIRWTGATRPPVTVQRTRRRRDDQDGQGSGSEAPSALMGHALSDMVPSAKQGQVEPHAARAGASVEGATPAGANAPPELETCSDADPTKPEMTSSSTSAPPAPSPTSSRASVTDAGLQTLGDRGRAAVRRELTAAKLDGQGASARSIHAIAQAVGTIGNLRQLVTSEAAQLEAADRPIAWLAHICRAEGAAVRAHDFRSRARRSAEDPERAARAGREEAAAAQRAAVVEAQHRQAWCHRLAREAGDDPAKMLAAARALRDEAMLAGDALALDTAAALERQSDGVIRHRRALERMDAARAVAATWPPWEAVRRAAAAVPEPRNGARSHPDARAAACVRELAGVRWHAIGDAVVMLDATAPSPTPGDHRVADELARFVARELARHERTHYRVTVEDVEGRRLAASEHRGDDDASIPETAARGCPGPGRELGQDQDLEQGPGHELGQDQDLERGAAREPRRPGATERAKVIASLERTVSDRAPGWKAAEKVLASLERSKATGLDR